MGMKPYFETETGEIYQGHALEVLKGMEAESCQMVVTSPPYWGLRDYKLPPMVWDSEPPERCEGGRDHVWESAGYLGTRNRQNSAEFNRPCREHPGAGQFCQRCNAWRGSFGLEPTPELYVKHAVEIFREVWRVLRKDGTVWLNLGDSYAGSGTGNNGQEGYNDGRSNRIQRLGGNSVPGLKPKDLCMIPARVALALQADGWWLRQDIIWQKPNPMPESVTDRCTKAHEYIFLLTKSARYFYDAEAIKEEVTGNAHARGNGVNPKAKAAWKTPDGWDTSRGEGGHGSFHKKGREKGYQGYKVKQNPSFSAACNQLVSSRNKRSVWTVATHPFPGAHFAVFPPKLIEPCILAGCPKGGTVLDPFFGRGTTGLVAYKHGRRWKGIDLSPEYCEMAKVGIEKETRQMRLFG